MQSVAQEMNLSETAFLHPEDDGFRLRWMTPAIEVDLCGHATLASAHVLLRVLKPERTRVSFATRSGELVVAKDGDRLAMDFPARPPREVPFDEACAKALGARPSAFVRALSRRR